MKLRYRIGTKIIYFVWRVFFGIKIIGREKIPKNGGLIIAANHLSNYDPPLLGTAVWIRECYFFAKKELFHLNKFFTWLIRAFNAYEVDTQKANKKTIKWTKELLKKGISVIMFPEGTRSLVGHFLEFNPGVAWLSLNCKVPIMPVCIKNTNKSLISQFFRINKVYIKFGDLIFPDNKTKEQITKELYDKITSLYENI